MSGEQHGGSAQLTPCILWATYGGLPDGQAWAVELSETQLAFYEAGGSVNDAGQWAPTYDYVDAFSSREERDAALLAYQRERAAADDE